MGTPEGLLCSPSAPSSSVHGRGGVRIFAASESHQCRVCCRAYWPQLSAPGPQLRCCASPNGAMPWKSRASGNQPGGNPIGNVDKFRNKLEYLYSSDSSVPTEGGVKPTGLASEAAGIGNKPRCVTCEAKGAVQCATCSGSGLYVDSILESQGIIVKVRCLGCGGCGDILCPKCGGRGHV